MIVFLLIMITLLIGFIIFLTSKLLRLNDILEDTRDQVDQSLDIIDDCYGRISAVAEMPVTFDDPVVHQLLSDIKLTKHSLLLIANKITIDDNEENEEKELE
jgi:hypothetical protein